MRTLRIKNHRSQYWPAFFVLLLATSSCVLDVSAQKRKPVDKKPVVIRSMPLAEPGICIPSDSNFNNVLQIDNKGKVTLTTQTSSRSGVLFDANFPSSANDILTSTFKPTITIKADHSLRYELVVKVLKDVRQALDRCFNVEASTRIDAPYVYIYPEPRESTNLPVYLNPLILVTRLANNSDLTLNNESLGSLSDASLLRDRLRAIFKSREENGVFRRDTNETEKEVRLRADGSVRFGDVVKLVDVLKDAGASPVGLLIDDAQDVVEIQLEMIKPESPKPKPKRSKP